LFTAEPTNQTVADLARNLLRLERVRRTTRLSVTAEPIGGDLSEHFRFLAGPSERCSVSKCDGNPCKHNGQKKKSDHG
jgi:hypothetical protein